MLKAVIFDLDGTIGDTLPICVQAFQNSVEPLSGKKLTMEEIISHFGPSEEGVIAALLPGRYEAGMAAYLHHYAQLHEMSPAPFEGIRELLAMLHENGVKNTIVTGKGAGTLAITLERYGLTDAFDAVETGSPLGPCKAEKIGAVLGQLGIQKEEAIYVGDAPSDITEANNAGIAVYSAAWASTAEPVLLEQMNPGRVFTRVEAFAAFARTLL